MPKERGLCRGPLFFYNKSMKTLIYFLISFSALANQSFTIPFTILHTNDLHSFVTGVGVDKNAFDKNQLDKDQKLLGHFARMSTLIQERKKS